MIFVIGMMFLRQQMMMMNDELMMIDDSSSLHSRIQSAVKHARSPCAEGVLLLTIQPTKCTGSGLSWTCVILID